MLETETEKSRFSSNFDGICPHVSMFPNEQKKNGFVGSQECGPDRLCVDGRWKITVADDGTFSFDIFFYSLLSFFPPWLTILCVLIAKKNICSRRPLPVIHPSVFPLVA